MWRADRDGSNRVELVDPPLKPILPRWSPDGKRIVFVGLTQKENEYQAYIVSSQGGAIRRVLPKDGGPQTDPDWSPDGKKIVYSTSPLGGRDTKSTIDVLDVETRDITTLPGSDGMFSPRWSPDGKYISASTFDQLNIKLFDLAAQRWTTLHNGIIAFPAWSADSRFIYYLLMWMTPVSSASASPMGRSSESSAWRTSASPERSAPGWASTPPTPR